MSRTSHADFPTEYARVALPTGPFVLASNATRDSDAAFPLAQVLAWHTQAAVEVVSVVGPLVAAAYPSEAMLVPSDDDDARFAEREERVRAQMNRQLPPGTDWPVTVCVGETAQALVDHATIRHARAILVGRTRHGVIPRLLGGETVVRLLQVGDRPVFAVDAALTRLPRRVVIGTDLSVYSHHAARVALTMIAPDATVFLVHVAQAADSSRDTQTAQVAATLEQTRLAMTRMRATFDLAEQQIEEIHLTGNAAEQLAQFATDVDADLIVTATRGLNFMRRLLVGSVATALLRGSPCSVLCIPGSARTHAVAESAAGASAVLGG